MLPVDKNQKLDETRRRLIASRERLETQLSEQFNHISDDAKKVGKTALLVGGGLFLTYKLVKLIIKDDEDIEEAKVLKEKTRVKRDRKGQPLVVKKEQKVGLTFGQLLKQQALTLGMLVVSSQIKKQLKKHHLLDE
jgi:uncharacterized protein YneF (UPF0154 family)